LNPFHLAKKLTCFFVGYQIGFTRYVNWQHYSWGCFQVRRTKHSFIVTSNVGRIPIKKVQFRKRTVRYRMPSRGDPGFQKVIKDTEVKESPSPGRFLEIGV